MNDIKDQIKNIVDDIEIYTIGRPKKDRVHITVEELQSIADRLDKLADKIS